MKVHGDQLTDVSLSFYLYIVRSYLKFFVTEKCLEYPWLINIQTQSYCNGKCLICPYPTMHTKLAHGTMKPELFKKIAAELVAIKQSVMINLTLQNEPTLDENIFNLVKHIKSQSPHKHCSITTNGTLLDNFSPEEIAQSEIDILRISLNAYSSEMYQRINCGLDYERVMDNITTLIENPLTRERIELAFTLNQLNMNEIEQAIDYWNRRGVVMRVNTITNRAGTLEKYNTLGCINTYNYKKRILRLWKRITSRARQKLGCEFPFYQMNILYSGDVIICCHDWSRQLIIGNVIENSLKEIWNSPTMQETRSLLLHKRSDMIDPCRGCSLIM